MVKYKARDFCVEGDAKGLLLELLSLLKPAYSADGLMLALSDEVVEDAELGITDGYTFLIYERKPRRKVGYVSLRVGESPQLYYLGHIGYRVDEAYRGHGYAAKACEMLYPLYRRLGIRSLVITCNPENTPSRKTCEKLGCVLESTVDVPPEYRFICAGARQKCRYILRVPQEA